MTLTERLRKSWREWRADRKQRTAFSRWFNANLKSREYAAWASMHWKEYQECLKETKP